MINSYIIDLRILFKKFYCPICGNKLNVANISTELSEEQKKDYYKKLYPHGIPLYKDVAQVKQVFICSSCDYYNTTDNQLQIRKKQKQLKKKIIDVSKS